MTDNPELVGVVCEITSAFVWAERHDGRGCGGSLSTRLTDQPFGHSVELHWLGDVRALGGQEENVGVSEPPVLVAMEALEGGKATSHQ